MNQKINSINKINECENKLRLSNKNPNLKNGNENKIIISLNSKNQKEIENKNESLKKELNIIQILRPNFKRIIKNKIVKINKIKNIIQDDSITKIKQIINGKNMKNEKIIFGNKKKSIQKEIKNEEESPAYKNIINRKDIFFKNDTKLGNKKNDIISKYISKNKELSISKEVSNENKDNRKNKENKENKEFKKNEESKNNIEGKKVEKPEDISDYINMDEKDYNNYYKDLNGKITNEAIEEVEEAKEVSELRQSSEFFNNISNSKSSNKSNKILSIKDIENKKDGKEKFINRFNRCLTSKNEEKLNGKKKVISKKGNKKKEKNNSLNINMFNSNDSLRINNNKSLRISKNIIINNDHETITVSKINKKNSELNDKISKENLSVKKGKYIIKPIKAKIRINMNSDIPIKSINKIYIKKIIINQNKTEINNSSNVYKIYNIKNKSKSNQINNKISAIFKIHYKSKKLEKYENISKTVPNLKKILEKENRYDKDMTLKKNNTIQICYNNEDYKHNYKYITSKNNVYKNKMLKAKLKNNDILSNRNEICHKYTKYFKSDDKIKKLNKTNINISLKVYEQFFKDEQIKNRNKKVKIAEEKYHNLFKEYYLKINNNSPESLNKKTKIILNHPNHNSYKNSIHFKKKNEHNI